MDQTKTSTTRLPTNHVHFDTIKKNIPDWLINASAQTHRALRSTGAQSPPWLNAARLSKPDAIRQLQQVYVGHRLHAEKFDQLLARLPAPDVFAAPLLEAAIKEKFGVTVDVQTCYLYHARRVQIDQSFRAASRDPLVQRQNALKAATQSLLQAALQNFEVWEAEPGGMDQPGSSAAAIYDAYPILGTSVGGTVLPLPPEKFAALCRTLDLGGKYQALMNEVINPASSPGDAPDAATLNRRGEFTLFEASSFTLQVHLAGMKTGMKRGTQSALLALVQNKFSVVLEGSRLTCSFLELWEVELTGIVAIGKTRNTNGDREKIIVYIPDDPFYPLKEYESTVQFTHELRDRLLQPDYLKFFQRFVPARYRYRLLNKLNEALYPKVWNHNGWYENVLDRTAKLHLREKELSGPLLSELYRQKIAVLRDDGLFHAVPTAAEDQKTLDDKLRYFAEKTFEVLNIAAFVVPVLGEVMLVVTAAQLSYEVYEGIESLAKGEKEQAWGYLMDVVENVALMAALGAASAGSGGIAAVEVPDLVKQMRPVQLPDTSTRLWKPDLAPFAHDILLPHGLQPNELGLYDYQGKQWLALENRVFAVKAPLNNEPYRLQHPARPNAYEPKLRHNHAGAWLHELDQPLDWQGLTLFRRLGTTTAAFSDARAEHILRVSDTHEATLRRALVEGERPPALLNDTMQRFRLDQEIEQQTATADIDPGQERAELFQERYQALQQSKVPGVSVIQQAYPQLPKSIAEELLLHATPAELEQLRQGHRVPLRLAEEIRVYQHQVRLTRAYEGLYLKSVTNPDTDRLMLHSLEKLPGWSQQVRLEIRNESLHGPLVDSLGPSNAPIRKVLVKDGSTYATWDADSNSLHGRDDFCASVLHALPDTQRQALGLPHPAQGEDLRTLLQDQPLLPRQTLAERLQMQPRQPGSKSPMRLADGRAGYLLSGRGALSDYVARDTLLYKLRVLDLQESAEDMLALLERAGMSRFEINQRLDQLLAEQQALRSSLDRWTEATQGHTSANAHSRSRENISEALWSHWRTTSLPEIGRSSGPLRLQSASLHDFPEQLPDFVYDRTRALELNDVTVDGDSALGDHAALSQFFRRFPQVVSLSISRSVSVGLSQPLVSGLTELVADSFNGLRELRLIDQGMIIGQADINTFGRLEHLQRLDLSGNHGGFVPPNDLRGLSLQYLGLERMGLERWPAWLDSRLPEHISEVSLNNNRITYLPLNIVRNRPATGNHARISLRGNVLSRETIIRARLGEDGTRGAFSFDLDISDALQGEIDEMRRQSHVLAEAVAQWEQGSSSTTTLSQERVQARRETAETLRAFWRNRSEESGLDVLELDAVALNDFPSQLPDFFYQGVRYLELERVTANANELDVFLRRFTQLHDLTIRGHATQLDRLPQALLEMRSLSTLRLLDQRLLIDQPAMEFFARLPALDHLELDGNTLGAITDVSGLATRELSWLALNNVGLQTWPSWLSELMSGNMEALSLENNHITELPESILRNPRSENGCTEISLEGNPLSHDTMRRAHTSESYGHRYSFSMDLPPDILALDYEPHSSDSPQSSPGGHNHSPEPSTAHEPADVEPWLTGAVEEQPQRRGIWQQLESGNDASDLLSLVSRLRHTADYRTVRHRPELIASVWRVLGAAAQDTQLRLTLNGMSEEPLLLLRDYDTCPDGIRLEFNQMEVMIYTRQALLEAPAQQRGQSLYRLTRRLYRLDQLDRIAREQSGSRDEAEVRLAYRLQWAVELDLPLPPNGMLYRSEAHLQPGELERALGEVRQGEHGEPFMAYAAQRDFWVEYLRETYAARFRVLKEAFEARVLELLDLYPVDNPDQSAARIESLEQQYRSDEQSLIRELTNLERLKMTDNS